MKVILAVIGIIALFLFTLVSLNTGRIVMLFNDYSQVTKELINSNLYLANSNKLLSDEISALKKQVAELSDKVSKEFSRR